MKTLKVEAVYPLRYASILGCYGCEHDAGTCIVLVDGESQAAYVTSLRSGELVPIPLGSG